MVAAHTRYKLYGVLAAAMLHSVSFQAVNEQQSGNGRSALGEVSILAAATDRPGRGVLSTALQMLPFTLGD